MKGFTVTNRVHLGEDFVDAFFGRVLVLRQVEQVADHTVDRVHNVDHLLTIDVAVVIKVVQVERP